MNEPTKEVNVKATGELTAEQTQMVNKLWQDVFGEYSEGQVTAVAEQLEQLRVHTLESNKPLTLEIKNCARCGLTHNVQFHKFYRDQKRFTNWGMCPTTNEPVLMYGIDTEGPWALADSQLDAMEDALLGAMAKSKADIFNRAEVTVSVEDLRGQWQLIIDSQVVK